MTTIDKTEDGDISKAALLHLLQMELLPKFTDDYIDEWTSDNNDIEGLHKIIDDFAVELISVAGQYATIKAEQLAAARVDKAQEEAYIKGYRRGKQAGGKS